MTLLGMYMISRDYRPETYQGLEVRKWRRGEHKKTNYSIWHPDAKLPTWIWDL